MTQHIKNIPAIPRAAVYTVGLPWLIQTSQLADRYQPANGKRSPNARYQSELRSRWKRD